MTTKNGKQKALIIFISIVILFTCAMEVFLRVKFGLGKTLLFKSSDAYEYLPIPCQKIKRFGNTAFYNQFSQRNREISGNDSILVDFFGDSVLNGGILTDNDSLATSLLSDYWTEKTGSPALALNISAGSWGPDNCFGYLEEYGDFGTGKIVLVVSSHDAYDNMGFEPVVGVHPSYPDKQPFCALSEFINRYLPRYLHGFMKGEATDESKDLGINKKSSENAVFNKGFQRFHDYCRGKNIDLLIYLHADRREWENNEYNEQGEEIIGFCLKNDIRLIKELDFRFPEDAYRDNIHLNPCGQRKMFEALKDALPL